MKRVIASILINQEDCVKTKNFKKPIYLGDPINIVKLFSDKCADELCISDISKDRYEHGPNFALLKKMCAQARMPIAYGGGVRNISDVDQLIKIGIERIVLNTSFFLNPKLAEEIANLYGTQAVALCLDYRKDLFGRRHFVMNNGRDKIRGDIQEILNNLKQYEFGELILQNIDGDGTYCGLDYHFCDTIANQVHVPVLISAGAKDQTDLQKVTNSMVSGIIVGSLFVFKHVRKGILINYDSSWLYDE